MTGELTQIANMVFDRLPFWLLVFLRVGAAIAVIPAIGELIVPTRIKLGLAVMLTLIVAPALGLQLSAAPLRGSDLISAGAAEVVTGLAIGLALRLFVFALQVAGTAAAQATSLSQLLGAQGVDPQPALGAVLVMAGLALATLLGFHVKIVQMFLVSYEISPMGRPLPPGPLAEWITAAVSQMFRLAVVLAMPFLLASLLYNFALGVINRAMPQLMVAFVGAPAITFGALALLALVAPVILTVWVGLLDQQISDPFSVP